MVEVPGYDQPVEFPDSMSNADIAAVLQKQTAPAPKGEVSQRAAYRVARMGDPNAPDTGPGVIQKGLGAVVGDELAARMVGEAPGAVGLIAMALAPETAIPRAATWGPKMLAFAKGAAGRVLAGSTGGGLTKLATSESPSAAVDEALTQAKYGAIGEGIGAGLQMGAKGVMAGSKKGLEYLRGTRGGQLATEEMKSAIAEHANRTVEQIVKTVSADIHPEVLGADVGKMVQTFDRIAGDAALELYEVPKQIARGAKLPPVDISPITKDLVDIVKADERAGGFLSPLATQDVRARAVASGARTSAQDINQLAGEASDIATQGPLYERVPGAARIQKGKIVKPDIEARTKPLSDEAADEVDNLRQQIDAVLKARKATVPALINIRSKVSQILADPSAPEELRLVAKRIGTGRLDNLIEGALDAAGPGGADTWKAAVSHYAETAAIKEQALYKLAKTNPQLVEKYITPQRPDTVTTLKKLAQYSDMKDLIPNVQRKFLEARLKDGIEGFTKNVDEYGPQTVNNLFSDPKGAEAVRGLKELSAAVTEKLNAIGAGPESIRQSMMMALAKSAASAGTVGGITGYRATHSWEGSLAGIGLGTTIGYIAPHQLVKMAANPNTLKRTAALIRGLSKDSTPATFDALSRTINRAMQEEK